MEDIEYLEEFHDMVRTSIEPDATRKANDTRAGTLPSVDIYSDSSSSSIDIDIFEKLFDNDSDGELPKNSMRKKPKKKTTSNLMSNVRKGPTSFSSSDYDSDDSVYMQKERSKTLKGRSVIRDPIDSIDALESDLDECIPDRLRKLQPGCRSNPMASIGKKSSGNSSTTSSSKPKPTKPALDAIRCRPSINNAKMTNLQPATSTSSPKASVYKSVAPQKQIQIETNSTSAPKTQTVSYSQKPAMALKTQIVPQKLLMTQRQSPTQKSAISLQKSKISQIASSSSKPTQKLKLFHHAKQLNPNQALGNGKIKAVYPQKSSDAALAPNLKTVTQPRANMSTTGRRTFLAAKDLNTPKQLDPKKDPLNLDENDFGDVANDSDLDDFLSLTDDDDDDDNGDIDSESFDSSDLAHESDDDEEHVIDISTDSNFSSSLSELRSTPPPNVSDSDETTTAEKFKERMQRFLEDIRVNLKHKTFMEHDSDCSLDSIERSLEAKFINSSSKGSSKCDLTNDTTIHKTLLDKETNENIVKILIPQLMNDEPSSTPVVIEEECVAVETNELQGTTKVDKDNQLEHNVQTESDSVKSPITTTIESEETESIEIKPKAESTPLPIGSSCSTEPTTDITPTTNQTILTEVLELPSRRKLYEEKNDTTENVQSQKNSNVMDDFDESITIEQIEQSSLELQKQIMEMDSDFELSLDINRQQSANSWRNLKSTNYKNTRASSTTSIQVIKPDIVKKQRGRPKKQRAKTTDEPKSSIGETTVKTRAFSDSALETIDNYCVENNSLTSLKREENNVTEIESKLQSFNELEQKGKTESKENLKEVEQKECVRTENITAAENDVEKLHQDNINQKSALCDDLSTAMDEKKDVEKLIDTITILAPSKEETNKSVEETIKKASNLEEAAVSKEETIKSVEETTKKASNLEEAAVSPTNCKKEEETNKNIELPSKLLNLEKSVSKSEKYNSNKSIPESDNKFLGKDQAEVGLNKLNDVKENNFERPQIVNFTNDLNPSNALDRSSTSSRESKRSNSRSSNKHKEKKHRNRDRSHVRRKSSDKKGHCKESSRSSSKAKSAADKDQTKSHKKHDEKRRQKHDSSHRKEKRRSLKSHKTEDENDKNKKNDDDMKLTCEKESKKDKKGSKVIDGMKDKNEKSHSKSKNKETETKSVQDEKTAQNKEPKVEKLKGTNKSISSQNIILVEKKTKCIDSVDSQIDDKPDKIASETRQESVEKTQKKISKNPSEKLSKESFVADPNAKVAVNEHLLRSKRTEHNSRKKIQNFDVEKTKQAMKSTLQKESNSSEKSLESNENRKSDINIDIGKLHTEKTIVENYIPKISVDIANQQEEVFKSLNTIENSEVVSDTLNNNSPKISSSAKCDGGVSVKGSSVSRKMDDSPRWLDITADLTTKSAQKKDLIKSTKDAAKTKLTRCAAENLFEQQKTELDDESKSKNIVSQKTDLQSSISTRSASKSKSATKKDLAECTTSIDSPQTMSTRSAKKSLLDKLNNGPIELGSKDSDNAKGSFNSASKLTRSVTPKATADCGANEFQPKEEFGDSIKDTERPQTPIRNEEIVSKDAVAKSVRKNMLSNSKKPKGSLIKKSTRSTVKNLGVKLKVDTEESDSSAECNRKKELGTEAVRNTPVTRSSIQTRTESLKTDGEESDSRVNEKQILKKSNPTEKLKTSDNVRTLPTAEESDSKESFHRSSRKTRKRDEKGKFIRVESKNKLLKPTETDAEEENRDCVDNLKHTPKRMRKTPTDLENMPKILRTTQEINIKESAGTEIKDNQIATGSVNCVSTALQFVDAASHKSNEHELSTTVSSTTMPSTTQETVKPEAEITKNSKQELESLVTSVVEVKVSTSIQMVKDIQDNTTCSSADKEVCEDVAELTILKELDIIDQVGHKNITTAVVEQTNEATARIDRQLNCENIAKEVEDHTPYEHLPEHRTPTEDLLPAYDEGMLGCVDDMVIEQFIEVEFSQMENSTDETHVPSIGDGVDDTVTREFVDILSANDGKSDSEIQKNNDALAVEMTDEEFLNGLIDFALPNSERTTSEQVNIVADHDALDALLILEQTEITEKLPTTTDDDLYQQLAGDQVEELVVQSRTQKVDNSGLHENDINVIVNEVGIEESKESGLNVVDNISSNEDVMPIGEVDKIIREAAETVKNILKTAVNQAETTTPNEPESTTINENDKNNKNNIEKKTTKLMQNDEKHQEETTLMETTIEINENKSSATNNVHETKSTISNDIRIKKLRVNLKRNQIKKLVESIKSDVIASASTDDIIAATVAMARDVDGTKEKAKDDVSMLNMLKRPLRKRGVENATTTTPTSTPYIRNAAIRRRELEHANLISKTSNLAVGKSVEQKLLPGKSTHSDRFEQPSHEAQPSKKQKLSSGIKQSPLKASPAAITINTKVTPDLKTKNALLKLNKPLNQGKKVVAKPAQTITTIGQEVSQIDAKSNKVVIAATLSKEVQINQATTSTAFDGKTETSKTQAANKEVAATKSAKSPRTASKEWQAAKIITTPAMDKRSEAQSVAKTKASTVAEPHQSLPKQSTNAAMLKLFSSETSQSPVEENKGDIFSDKGDTKTILEPVSIKDDNAKMTKMKQSASSVTSLEDTVSSTTTTTTATAKETATKPATESPKKSAPAKTDENVDNAEISGATKVVVISTNQAENQQQAEKQTTDSNQKASKEAERGRKKMENSKIIKKPSTCGDVEVEKDSNILLDHENSIVFRDNSNERTPRRAAKKTGGSLKLSSRETSHDRAMSSNETESGVGGKRETSKDLITRKSLRAVSMTPTIALLSIRNATHEKSIATKPEDAKHKIIDEAKNDLPSEAELVKSINHLEKPKQSAVELQTKSGKRKTATGVIKVSTKRSRLNAVAAVTDKTGSAISKEATTETTLPEIQTVISDKKWQPRVRLNRRVIDNRRQQQSCSNDLISPAIGHTDLDQDEGAGSSVSSGATKKTPATCVQPFTFLEPKSEVDEETDQMNTTTVTIETMTASKSKTKSTVCSSPAQPTIQTRTRIRPQATLGGTAATVADAAFIAEQTTELVPRSVSNTTLLSNEIDTSAHVIGRTSMYSYLYPAKYDRSYGNVQLDYCCPNLNGPMRAIDPTRLHQEMKAPIRELPSCIVMTTKVVKASEYKKNRDILPEPVRLKLERRNGGISLASVLGAGGGVARNRIPKITTTPAAQSVPTIGNTTDLTKKTSQAQATTKAASQIPKIVATVLSSSLPQLTAINTSANDKSKKLPTEILTSKSINDALAVSSSETSQAVLPDVASVGNNQLIAAQSLQRPMPLFNVDLMSLTGLQSEQRQQLLRSVQLFDELLQSLAKRVLTLSVQERQRTISAIVGNSHLEAIDFEVGMKLLKNYETWINEVSVTTTTTSTATKPQTQSSASALKAATTTSSAVVTRTNISTRNQQVKTTTAKSTVICRKSSGSGVAVADGTSAAPVAKRPCKAVPILGTNNEIVGYQFRTNVDESDTVATTTAATTRTTAVASTTTTTVATPAIATNATSADTIKTAPVPSTSYRTRRGAVQKSTPPITPTSLHVTSLLEHPKTDKQTPAPVKSNTPKQPVGRPRGRGGKKNTPVRGSTVRSTSSSATSTRSNQTAKSSRSVARNVQASPISIATVNTCGSPGGEECILPDAVNTTPLDPSLIKIENDEEMII